jgi:hypothetical protein
MDLGVPSGELDQFLIDSTNYPGTCHRGGPSFTAPGIITYKVYDNKNQLTAFLSIQFPKQFQSKYTACKAHPSEFLFRRGCMIDLPVPFPKHCRRWHRGAG